jgi:predicted RNase H-like HicB family nuclease
MNLSYTTVFLKERDGGYSVSVPALRGCHTQGDDLPEAMWMAQEAIRLFLEHLQAHGKPIPPDVASVTVALGDAVDAEVYRVAVREGAVAA